MRRRILRSAIVVTAWLPFFAVCVLFAMLYARATFHDAILLSLNTVGSASILGVVVWHVCQRRPWPLRFSVQFYLLQMFQALAYATVWTVIASLLESIRHGTPPDFSRATNLAAQVLMGVWLYLLFAGLSYIVQTRNRLRDKEVLAAHAQTLAAAARLDAIRARLNPHFLFNALHTLDALVKFRPSAAESAIERLGDMLRYTLKEDGRELVEFSAEYDFTRQYLAFEQIRYEDRLKVDLRIDPDAFNFDVLPFSIQTLAENAVRHAISMRAEGGSICITCACRDGTLTVTVSDDGPGESPETTPSHQFGLRSLRERLRAAHGPATELHTDQSPAGFTATFAVLGVTASAPLNREPLGHGA